MKKRPYSFTAEWRKLPENEFLGTKFANFLGKEVYVCQTEDAQGILIRISDQKWSAAVVSNETCFRCYWSDSYAHRGECLSEAEARDLCEAALIGASLFGLEKLGTNGCCP